MPRSLALIPVLMLVACAAHYVPQVGIGDCQAGMRHGPYKLRVVNGPTVATGFFVDGKKHGVFTFYTTGGTKVAEIPYANDAKTGTIRLWYSEFAYPDAAGRLKLEVEYKDDVANGHKRSWWPSGGKRSSELFQDGKSIEVEAWDEAGASLPRTSAEELSSHDADADEKYYRLLESEIDHYSPACVRPAA
jgi:hypothetical protein